jgi:hypothetical protein
VCPSEKQFLWQYGRSKATNSRTDLKTAAAVGLIATQTAEQDVYQAESVLEQQQQGPQESSTSPGCGYNEWDPLEVDLVRFDQPGKFRASQTLGRGPRNLGWLATSYI